MSGLVDVLLPDDSCIHREMIFGRSGPRKTASRDVYKSQEVVSNIHVINACCGKMWLS